MAERTAHYDKDGERDCASEMVDWLSDKPQDVWADVAPNLNWDSAEHVLLWMVEQERCDLAVATWILWGTDITSVVKDGRYPEWRSSAAGKIAVTVINNVRRSLYRSSRLRFAQPHRGDLLHAVEQWRAVPDMQKRKHSDLNLGPPPVATAALASTAQSLRLGPVHGNGDQHRRSARLEEPVQHPSAVGLASRTRNERCADRSDDRVRSTDAAVAPGVRGGLFHAVEKLRAGPAR